MNRWTSTAVLVLAPITAWVGTGTLEPRDAVAIRAVLEHYRTSWLSNDVDGVRGSFSQDAVLMPHHGIEPVVGMKAINDFWFALNTAKTTILEFVQTVDEVDRDDALAFVRGRRQVAWKVEDKGKTEDWRNAGNFVAIFKKQANGQWRISRLICDDPPNERT